MYATITGFHRCRTRQERGRGGQGDQTALTALLLQHQAERQDAAAYDAAHFTVLALATTYAGATLALLNNELAASDGAAVILVMSLPLWLAGIYLLMLTVAGGARNAAALDLESRGPAGRQSG